MTIDIKGLTRRFDGFALEEVSLRLESGSYHVLLGPSGAGKSLLLRAIAGLLPIDDGRLFFGGRDLTRAPPEARDVGLVFQQGALFPHYSVHGNIEYGLKARGLSKAERDKRVAEAVAALGLSMLMDRPVATLSGGETQRVAIARALAIRPTLLLLDEPLSLLDLSSRLKLQTELRRLHAELRLTTLHVTHSREEAQALGERCAVILGGRIVQSGAMADVMSQPRCPFVAGLLGLPPPAAAPSPACAARCLSSQGQCNARED